jgi:arsenite methyltransferase
MATVCRVYEQEAVLRVMGEAIRPGGLALTERAMVLCALPAGARMLDVGCGAGATVEQLTTRHHLAVVGIDLSALHLQAGHRRNPCLPLARAAGERLPIADGSVDAVLAECSLSVMTDVDCALAEFRRVLRSGGILVVSDVYARNLANIPALRRLPVACCLTGALSRQEITGRLEAHGFRLLLWEDHSDALRQLAVQIIMTHGSMERFWCQTTGGSVAAPQIRHAIAQSKPGYFLLIAEKGEDGSPWMT